DKQYVLPSNSSISVQTEANEIEVQAKYLWFTSPKIKLNSNQDTFDIKVSPIFSNKLLVIFISAIIVSFLLAYFGNDYIYNYLFKIIAISIMGLYLFYVTFGYRKYFKLEINKRSLLH